MYLPPPPPTCTGDLFAECPIEQFPGPAVEAVTDSSRYFVLRVQDGSGKWHRYTSHRLARSVPDFISRNYVCRA